MVYNINLQHKTFHQPHRKAQETKFPMENLLPYIFFKAPLKRITILKALNFASDHPQLKFVNGP